MSGAGVGHNSVAGDQLRSIIERVERLDDDMDMVKADMAEVYKEAKGNGFDVKAIRKLVALRKKDRGKVAEEKAMLELYANALGCLDLV